MTSYPVTFTVTRPWKLDRVQLLARVLLLAALSIAGVTVGFVMMLVYLALPAVAAALVAQKGSARFLAEDGPRLTRALVWLQAAFAYLFLLTDRLPLDRPAETARLDIDPTGAPTAKDALLRLLTSLPRPSSSRCSSASPIWRGSSRRSRSSSPSASRRPSTISSAACSGGRRGSSPIMRRWSTSTRRSRSIRVPWTAPRAITRARSPEASAQRRGKEPVRRSLPPERAVTGRPRRRRSSSCPRRTP